MNPLLALATALAVFALLVIVILGIVLALIVSVPLFLASWAVSRLLYPSRRQPRASQRRQALSPTITRLDFSRHGHGSNRSQEISREIGKISQGRGYV